MSAARLVDEAYAQGLSDGHPLNRARGPEDEVAEAVILDNERAALLAALEWALPFAEKYDTHFPGGPRASLMDAKLVELRALIAKARGDK